jgi:hypothetical protein
MGRPLVGPREPGKVPNEDRELPRRGLIPHALITRPIFHFLSTPLLILPVTHSFILPTPPIFNLQHVYIHVAIVLSTRRQRLGVTGRSLCRGVQVQGSRQLRRLPLPNIWISFNI